MGDYGMKVSRQGFDVKTCADHQLLFSSSFKMPVIVQSGTYYVTSPGTTQDIATHNLGFYPVVLSWYTTASAELHMGTLYEGPVAVSTTKIFYKGGSASSNKNIAYFILNVDLEEDYTAPIINTTAASQTAVTTDYGFKVSKDGYDVKTAGLGDLASFSGSSAGGQPVRHQIIHKVGGVTGHVTNTTITIPHGLGYTPMYLVFRRWDDGPNHYWTINQIAYEVVGPPVELVFKIRTWVDATNLSIYHDRGSDQQWRYIVFKDPFL